MYVALSTTSTVNMCHREEMYVALSTTSTVNMSQRRNVGQQEKCNNVRN